MIEEQQELTWSAVDQYFGASLLREDPVLDAALEANRDAGLPMIDVSPLQGRFLHLLAKVQGARRILEIGTLGGYSTICLARALPADGVLITLELDAAHAEVARRNIARAALACRVCVKVGPAARLLPTLKSDEPGAFDLIFIDADKASTPEYYRWALELSRPGSVILIDNAVRKGAVADATTTDPNVLGMRRVAELIGSDLGTVEATALQTVGTKGYDGFILMRVIRAKEGSQASGNGSR